MVAVHFSGKIIDIDIYSQKSMIESVLKSDYLTAVMYNNPEILTVLHVVVRCLVCVFLLKMTLCCLVQKTHFHLQVNLNVKQGGKRLEHQGIRIEFVGQIGDCAVSFVWRFSCYF